ncbi:Uncharacterised protein [Mycolicibacterium gilvum]|uniref:Uncharacterized protein n=1 Tax=Mycolicibacterium gilvum TaxID=1804 RepID=A0A378SNQ3_9MYCO|nr:Uncharacterised protein [Mycolicibacterium gilvum]
MTENATLNVSALHWAASPWIDESRCSMLKAL